MKTSLGLAVALLLVQPAPARAADVDTITLYTTTANVTPQGSDALQRLRLPLAVLQQSRSTGLADVRLFDANGKLVPLAWASAPLVAQVPPRMQVLPHFAWPAAEGQAVAPNLKLEWRSDGTVLKVEQAGRPDRPDRPGQPEAAATQVWLIDLKPLGEAQPPQALTLEWAAPGATGLVRNVRVESSTDVQAWRAAGQGVLVELASVAGAPRQVIQHRLALAALPANTRYLRLRADGALGLSRVQAELAQASPADTAALDSARFELREDQLDLGATLPIARIEFHLGAGNAVVPVSIDRRAEQPARSGAANWEPIASHTAFVLLHGGQTLRSPVLEMNDLPLRELRFRSHGSAAPQAVSLSWRAPHLLFAATGAPPYRLAIGRERALSVALPRAALLPGYQDGAEFKLPSATLGALEVKASSGTLTDTSPEQRRRWLLWAALAAAVAGLGALARSLMREMRKSGQAR